MPVVNGIMYPEARGQLHSLNELNVLILGDVSNELITFISQLNTLSVYINGVPNTNVSIKLHGTSEFNSVAASRYEINLHDLEYINESSVKDLVQTADIDIVFDQQDMLSKRYVQGNFYVFETVKTISDLVASCENFLLGQRIAWLFSGITWNLPLMMRYFSRPGTCSDYFAFMGECTTTKNYTTDQQNKVRYIANRIGQIEYSKDIIQSYIKQKRKAERNGYSSQDYNFELNYHLGNYYFLIAGVLDSMARLLNEILKLRLTRPSLALEKEGFVNANRRKRTGYVRILTKHDFVKWVTFMKERRNFIAHDGDMRQSPLVVQNDVLLSDDEVERIVDGQMDWSFAATTLSPQVIQAMRAQAAQIVRVQQDYREIARNVMIVPNDNGDKVYQPLPSIDYDYSQLIEVLSKLLERLKR
jgi:hypothetical protein